ncbi:MAG: ParA family protein [Deltaproteobacteria bacterium]
MKTIAVINFKGGVGKTTICWLLAKYAAEKADRRILLVDADAQMSLTLAVQLQESGDRYGHFETWYDTAHLKNKKTLSDALRIHANSRKFDFAADSSFVYQIAPNLHFVPSAIDLYRLEGEGYQRDKLTRFIPDLLGAVSRAGFGYDYVLFDCPAYFTPLAYSVLCAADLVVVPVNPDVFASRGVEIMIDGLAERIKPSQSPGFGVFMNKAKLRGDKPTRETQRLWEDVKFVCAKKRGQGVSIRAWECQIPEREDIKRAIPDRRFPAAFAARFGDLWINIESDLGGAP